MENIRLEQVNDFWIARFQAMASPCELLIDTTDKDLASKMGSLAAKETQRIEHKYSRYRNDNIIFEINHSNGKPLALDDETANLMDYAQICYEISDGLFDITSGILRRVWQFNADASPPEQQAINEILPLIGWDKVKWERPEIVLPDNMEIDLGGIGKEYAVDRCIELIKNRTSVSCLANFGGDIRVTGPRKGNQPWIIGVENPDAEREQKSGSPSLHLSNGAIATSGDSKKFLLHKGIRYGHIINPLTGWPPKHAPRSVTVVAETCTEAGILSTLAILSGENADDFLQGQCIEHWCEW